MSNANNPMNVPAAGAESGPGAEAEGESDEHPEPEPEQSARTTRLADGEDDETSIANPEDYLVERSGDGPWYESIEPVAQKIPGTEDHLMVRPLPPGPFNKWQAVLEGEDETTDKQVEIMRKAIVEPEVFANADADMLEGGLRGGVLGGILKAIRNASGYEVLQGNRQQELQENVALMEHLDEHQIERFANLAQSGSEES